MTKIFVLARFEIWGWGGIRKGSLNSFILLLWIHKIIYKTIEAEFYYGILLDY